MNINTIPHPPNSAWLTPTDPNDEQTLEQEQAMIEEEFKNILTQDIVSAVGAFDTRQQEQQQQEDQDDEVDDMDDYTDQIQVPDQEL